MNLVTSEGWPWASNQPSLNNDICRPEHCFTNEHIEKTEHLVLNKKNARQTILCLDAYPTGCPTVSVSTLSAYKSDIG